MLTSLTFINKYRRSNNINCLITKYIQTDESRKKTNFIKCYKFYQWNGHRFDTVRNIRHSE